MGLSRFLSRYLISNLNLFTCMLGIVQIMKDHTSLPSLTFTALSCSSDNVKEDMSSAKNEEELHNCRAKTFLDRICSAHKNTKHVASVAVR